MPRGLVKRCTHLLGIRVLAHEVDEEEDELFLYSSSSSSFFHHKRSLYTGCWRCRRRLYSVGRRPNLGVCTVVAATTSLHVDDCMACLSALTLIFIAVDASYTILEWLYCLRSSSSTVCGAAEAQHGADDEFQPLHPPPLTAMICARTHAPRSSQQQQHQ
uniref:Uncharacterized protein n=1 Tax=Trichogramma kaykai TaxID=54128 RepID=A0ABD2VW14_9HYME